MTQLEHDQGHHDSRLWQGWRRVPMAGIAGWLHWRENAAQQRLVLGEMLKVLAHRGPDGEELWLAEGVPAGMGQRTSAPYGMARIGTPPGPHWVLCFDGEIYNLAELGRGLCGQTPSEILLQAYQTWGIACLQRLTGPFAFALWDGAQQSLILARDHLGIRPLFVAQRGDTVVFASEIKGLLAHPLIEPKVDNEGLAEIWVLGPARTPGHGIFRDVTEVRAGQYMVIRRGAPQIHTHWQPHGRPHTDDLPTTTAKIRTLVTTALKQQLEPLDRTCVMLSGGLDSSILAALAGQDFRRRGPQRLRTFAVTYSGESEDFQTNPFQPDVDGPWAAKVAQYLQTAHQVITLDTSSLAAALTTAVRARDLPGMADVDTSLYLFCRAIAAVMPPVAAAIAGEGADEIFGGYPWFLREEALQADTFPWSLRLAERTQLMSPALRAALQPQQYLRYRYEEALARVPQPTSADAGEEDGEARRRQIFYLNLYHWLPTLLDRQDRMGMAAGLQIRLPFCDPDLIAYVWNIPWSLKTAGGMAKGVLRSAFAADLPNEVTWRQKSPYPKTHNPSYIRAVQRGVREILADPSSPLLDLIDIPAVTRLARAPLSPAAHPWFGQLMAGPQMLAYLMQIDIWLRRYRVRLL